MKRNIVFLGSKAIGAFCFQSLLRQLGSDFQVLGVLTNNRTLGASENATVAELANSQGIPVLKGLKELESMDVQIDFLISVQYHEIIPQRILNRIAVQAVNLHMAPLPDYRGCNQFSFAIIDGAKEFGTTLHVMERGIDSGAILAERRWEIPASTTVQQLYAATLEASKELFDSSILSVLNETLTPTPQAAYLNDRACNYHERSEIEAIKRIDLSWSEEKIDRYIRATYFPPFSPPYAFINGKRINLSPNWRSELP